MRILVEQEEFHEIQNFGTEIEDNMTVEIMILSFFPFKKLQSGME